MTSEPHPDLDLAYFSERALAFGIDAGLATLGFFLSMKVVFPRFGLLTNPHALAWLCLWVAIFIAYQGFCNAQGRSSWGKALLGIHVSDLEGRPLTLSQSFLRAAGYLPSSLSYLGFVWPLFNHRVQAWHDMIAKSVVVQDEPRAGRPLVVAGAWAVAGVVVGHWVWAFVLAGPYYRVRTVANANLGLEHLARLERDYKQDHGSYTGNIFALVEESGAPKAYLASLGMIFDTGRGLRLEPKGPGLVISAVARDVKHTPVSLQLDQ